MKFRALKQTTTWLGARCSPELMRKLNALLNYLETGHWLEREGYQPGKRHPDRWELFRWLAAQLENDPVLYLEFGVYRGASIRFWSEALLHPATRLHGFDSFEGLPEDWSSSMPRGTFSLGGDMPIVDDSRVEFFKGFFEDTLPHYTVDNSKTLVINMDADLYSSTIYVLERLDRSILPGTYLLFDEFADRLHELRAFKEYRAKSGKTFKLLAADRTLQHVLFKCVASP